MIRLGYPTQNLTIPASTNRTCRGCWHVPPLREGAPARDFKAHGRSGERVLVGAWAIAPLASEWIHQACLAVRTRTLVEVLLDSVFQFPTFSQGYLEALEKLDL